MIDAEGFHALVRPIGERVTLVAIGRDTANVGYAKLLVGTACAISEWSSRAEETLSRLARPEHAAAGRIVPRRGPRGVIVWPRRSRRSGFPSPNSRKLPQGGVRLALV